MGMLERGRGGTNRDAHSVTRSAWTVERLRAFEATVREAIEGGRVNGPCHLSGGNEQQLIDIFRDMREGDWCFSTYRSHYHALLHGLPEQYVMHEILAGRSMSLHSAEHRFFTSAIVGGCLPIALGVAAAISRSGNGERVWCFVGDMAASAGTFHDCSVYSARQDLPITFIIEDNGMSTYTPTQEAWGTHNPQDHLKSSYYCYTQTEPHIGARSDALL
jgi:pyruvate dehydrogenase E1 component alpha subunit